MKVTLGPRGACIPARGRAPAGPAAAVPLWRRTRARKSRMGGTRKMVNYARAG